MEFVLCSRRPENLKNIGMYLLWWGSAESWTEALRLKNYSDVVQAFTSAELFIMWLRAGWRESTKCTKGRKMYQETLCRKEKTSLIEKTEKFVKAIKLVPRRATPALWMWPLVLFTLRWQSWVKLIEPLSVHHFWWAISSTNYTDNSLLISNLPPCNLFCTFTTVEGSSYQIIRE